MKLDTIIQTTGINFKEEAKNWFFGYTDDGLLIEIKLTTKKTKQVIVGYNLSGKEQLRFCADLSNRWEFKSKVLVNLNNLDEIPSLIDEAIQIFRANGYAFKGERKSIKTPDEGYFEKAAIRIIRDVQDEWGHGLTREALGFDGHDELIKVGHSKAWEAAKAADPTYKGWREHIVPCTMIIQEAIRMAQEGTTVVDLAQMLKTNLAIVMISNEEQKHLDAVYQTTMPAGWQFGDSVTARLDVMNITY